MKRPVEGGGSFFRAGNWLVNLLLAASLSIVSRKTFGSAEITDFFDGLSTGSESLTLASSKEALHWVGCACASSDCRGLDFQWSSNKFFFPNDNTSG